MALINASCSTATHNLDFTSSQPLPFRLPLNLRLHRSGNTCFHLIQVRSSPHVELADVSKDFQNPQSFVISMDQAEINNWKSIAEKMEANGTTESWFYTRAKAIAEGKPDPMPEVSQLMPDLG